MGGATIESQTIEQKVKDGPVLVSRGDVFEKGKVRFEEAELASLPLLPRGYSALNNKAYRIATDAVASGPFTVVFDVSSITDEQTFSSLRILHAEPDEFDPDCSVWVDRTANGSNAPVPDFSHKRITAYSAELETGIYVVAKLTENTTPSTAVADLEVIARLAPGVVQMPANITLSMVVKNNGPYGATDVGLKQQLSRGTVVSMKPSQGTCKWKPGWVFCKLGQLTAGNSATIAVVIDPLPDFVGQYRTAVEVAGKEIDSNPKNNLGIASVDTRGDPNLPPKVTLESPEMEQLFEPGATVNFRAVATDSDGSITKVEFFDNEQSLGVGSTADAKHFSFSSNQLANGFHVLAAVATDNGGRSTESGVTQVFVNGPIEVRILKPEAGSSLTTGSDLTLTAVATNTSGSVKMVEFVCNGFSLGQAAEVGDNRYTIKLPRLEKTTYSIQAIATDEAGLVSKSTKLRLKITK